MNERIRELWNMAAANNGRQSDMAFGVVTGVERVALEIIKQFEV